MKNKEEKIAYQGKIVEIVEYPVGDKVFEKARRSPGVRLIIKTKDGKFLLNREKRHELGLEEDLRLPGGKVFDSLAEFNDSLQKEEDIKIKAKEAAIKEGKEETGIKINEMEFFTISKCGATMEWDLYYFVVTDYEEGEKDLKETEQMEMVGTVALSREELKDAALSGKMQEDRSVAVVLKYLNK